ncbi:YlmC/YmxH family sporulation protein [Paenibacillus algorifonticola]|uniref:Sporulation protein, YlmC/YmxH family n=2 Tax=Paenibacillus TaxID=44249 RepID=A0A1I1XSN6_9BACL|nr:MULTISPECIES: YlmC/YmxH family sporulation protein [Paenibacillus]ANY71036.1 YlmC/YmxH family sporulation protein [Paenibacillus sp. BIHB 4019]KQN97872.1 YlmC/YmxH family sporulation protein [Paenibacillus sp. Leaf72]SFE10269.1 sporulation protein, YlmC/YmxH family [Paenibacillus algorifonticola]
MKISDFQTKDVINIVDGKKLGHITDLELDLRQGRIDSIVIPQYSRFMGLFGGPGGEVVIPWRNIVKIGADVVLVRMDETKQRLEEEDLHARG